MVEEKDVWVPVKEYEGIYEVSNKGKIRSIDRIDRRGRFRKGVELKLRFNHQCFDDDDSWYVRLSKNGRVRDLNFNRIYGAAFHRKLPLPPPDRSFTLK